MRTLSGLLNIILMAGIAFLSVLPWAAPSLPLVDSRRTVPLQQANSTEDPLLQGDFTLAISWHTAFCETAPRRPECTAEVAQTVNRKFVLHGLWPDPVGNIYCAVPENLRTIDQQGQWSNLPAIELDAVLVSQLANNMPGLLSNLHRHEWVKHGTCSGADAEQYFVASLALLDAINKSGLPELFAENVGEQLGANAVRRAFDSDFGTGSGLRVEVVCERDADRRLITELRIGLSGGVGTEPDIGALTSAAPERDRGCPGGLVDPLGDQ